MRERQFIAQFGTYLAVTGELLDAVEEWRKARGWVAREPGHEAQLHRAEKVLAAVAEKLNGHGIVGVDESTGHLSYGGEHGSR